MLIPDCNKLNGSILSRPYRGVIAENDIRRLRTQVHVEHCKLLKGRARRAAEHGGYAGRFEEGDDIEDDLSSTKQGSGRLCEQVAKKRGGGTVVAVSKEKLLEASLASVESLGRQRRCGAPLGSGAHDSDVFRSGTALRGMHECVMRYCRSRFQCYSFSHTRCLRLYATQTSSQDTRPRRTYVVRSGWEGTSR